VSLQCLWHNSVSLISTLLLSCLLIYLCSVYGIRSGTVGVYPSYSRKFDFSDPKVIKNIYSIEYLVMCSLFFYSSFQAAIFNNVELSWKHYMITCFGDTQIPEKKLVWLALFGTICLETSTDLFFLDPLVYFVLLFTASTMLFSFSGL